MIKKRVFFAVVMSVLLWLVIVGLFAPRGLTSLTEYPMFGTGTIVCVALGVGISLWLTSLVVSPGVLTGRFEPSAPAALSIILLALIADAVFSVLYVRFVQFLDVTDLTLSDALLGLGLRTVVPSAAVAMALVQLLVVEKVPVRGTTTGRDT